MSNLDQHQVEIHSNLESWRRKPILRQIYTAFYQEIAAQLAPRLPGVVAELGSGIGNIRDVIPNCIRTDLFPNPWLDQVENAYSLSFSDQSVANLILFDVFHHLRYPGTALREFHRVLKPGGRVIIFEPCVSLLGRVVYGWLHHEPLALKQPITWEAPSGWTANAVDYYAAQGNAARIFLRETAHEGLVDWHVQAKKRLSALSYVASGGYSKPQVYPDWGLGVMQAIDRLGDLLPAVFATRLLVTLEKKATHEDQ